MKRKLSILATFLFIFLLACGGTEEPEPIVTEEPGDPPVTEPTDAPATDPTDPPVVEPTDEPMDEPPSDAPSDSWTGSAFAADSMALGGVTVTINGVATQSDGGGNFALSVPRADDARYVINAEKDGYLPVSQIHIGSAIEGLVLEFQQVDQISFDPTVDNDLEDNSGTMISIGANELVDENGEPATGEVTANMYTYDLDEEEMVGDMGGINDEGEPTAMVSAGAFYADFSDEEGNELNLADGETAEVSMPCEEPVDTDEQLTVWSYDPDTGMWIEEGSATIENDTCSAEVSHFSYWNFDYEMRQPACIKVDVDAAMLGQDGPVRIKGVQQTDPERVFEQTITEGANVLYNVPANAEFHLFSPPDAATPYAIVNSGAPWGETGRPPAPYTACNGVATLMPGTPLILQSHNFPERYLALSEDGTQVQLVPVSADSDAALKQRATFMQVPGLADASLVSLRASNGAYVVATPEGVTLQATPDNAQDATFSEVAGLAGSGMSFESLSNPGYHLRHSGFVLRLAVSNQSDLYNEDSTYNSVVDFTAAEEAASPPPQGGTIEGKVTDIASGNPIAGAEVCVDEVDECATTDSEGNYVLADLPTNQWELSVTATGYIAVASETVAATAGESTAQDFALTVESSVLAELPDDAVLRGVIFCIGDLSCSTTEATVVVGTSFQFLDTNVNGDYPDYNLSDGDRVLGVRVALSGGVDISILVPKRSETDLGKAANSELESATFEVVTIGDVNQPLQRDDQMEVVLTDPSSSNPPYIVNMYRGEGDARVLVATFTINKQQTP